MNLRLALAAVCVLPASLMLAQQPAAAPAGQAATDAPLPPPARSHAPRTQGGPGGPMAQRAQGGPGGWEGPGERGFERGPGRGFRPGGEHGGLMAAGFHLPPGAWWKNTELATRIGLSADQTKRLEELSLESRLNSVRMRAAIEEDELRLEPLVSGPNFDEKRAEAALDKIVDERAALEKAEAKSMVTMRAVLTPDQWTKLKEDRRGPGRFGGPGGFNGGPAEGPGGPRPNGSGPGRRGGGAPPAPTE